jgi:hypothetical protein
MIIVVKQVDILVFYFWSNLMYINNVYIILNNVSYIFEQAIKNKR